MWVIPQSSLSEARQQTIYTPVPNSPRLSVPPGELNSQAPKAFLQIGKVDPGSLRAEVPQSDTGTGCCSEGTRELVSHSGWARTVSAASGLK